MPTGAHANPVCADLFQTDRWSTLSSRAKLIDAADAFFARPSQQRRFFRHAAFTESANDVLRELDIIYRRFPIGLNANHRAALAFVRDYVELLKTETARIRKDGDVTQEWAFHLAVHAARAASVLIPFYEAMTKDGTVHAPNLKVYKRLRAKGENTDFLIRKEFEENTQEADRKMMPGILQIPSARMFSPEGVVELIAHGVHTIGFFSQPQHSGFYADGYAGHDQDHQGTFVDNVISAGRYRNVVTGFSQKDITELDTYRLFLQRLLFISDALKKLPTESRKAGFAVLFFAVHERLDLFYRDFVHPYDPSDTESTRLRLQSIHSSLIQAQYQLKDRTDLGHTFPYKWWRIGDDYSVKDPEKIAKLGAGAVTEAFRKYYEFER